MKVKIIVKAIKIYPNPTSGKVSIEIQKGIKTDITLSNLQGSILHEREDVVKYYSFNTDKIKKGTYLITIQSTVGKYSRKLVIE